MRSCLSTHLSKTNLVPIQCAFRNSHTKIKQTRRTMYEIKIALKNKKLCSCLFKFNSGLGINSNSSLMYIVQKSLALHTSIILQSYIRNMSIRILGSIVFQHRCTLKNVLGSTLYFNMTSQRIPTPKSPLLQKTQLFSLYIKNQ